MGQGGGALGHWLPVAGMLAEEQAEPESRAWVGWRCFLLCVTGPASAARWASVPLSIWQLGLLRRAASMKRVVSGAPGPLWQLCKACGLMPWFGAAVLL